LHQLPDSHGLNSGNPPSRKVRKSSASAHHLFKYLPTAHAVSHAVERQPSDFTTRNRHFIRHDVPVNVHRGADVRVPHQFLLHGYRRSNRIKPCPVAVPHRVSTESA